MSLTDVVEKVLLLEFSDIFNQNLVVVRIVLCLGSILTSFVRHRSMFINADIEKYRDYVEFHVLDVGVGE